jgi:hypothetical protein
MESKLTETEDLIGRMNGVLSKKYLEGFQNQIGRQTGKTSFALEMYVQYKRVTVAVETCGLIPFKELPLNICHKNNMVQDLVLWRLKENV